MGSPSRNLAARKKRAGRVEVWVNKVNVRRAPSQEEEQRGRTRDRKQRGRQDVAWYHRDTETSHDGTTAATKERRGGGRGEEGTKEGKRRRTEREAEGHGLAQN